MNQQMWAAPATLANLETLLSRGLTQLGPASGEQACGDVGYGRMLEPEELVNEVTAFVAKQSSNATAHEQLLVGKRVMITAGPTREAIDPVRYISNHSSGKMGYALARAAQSLGASVTLVSGPVELSPPSNIEQINVISAQDMLGAVEENIASQDIFIACAAVADYRIASENTQKLKKKAQELSLTFTQNPDILKTVASRTAPPFTLGFAAETNDVENYARKKLVNKKLNMIAANDVSIPGLGFNSDRNALIVITKEHTQKLAPASKDSLALELLKLLHLEYTRTQKN